MSGRIAVIALVALCAGGLGRSACAETIHIVVDGQPRNILLERPKTPGPHQTILMLHGANGTAERIAQQTGLAHLGPQEGVVVVFPQSRANVWNRFPAGKESPQALEFFRKVGGPPNDIGYLKMLVAELVRRGISDPARIYLAGVSNGGFMALSMFCSEPGMFAGIGLAVASMTDQTGNECQSAKPLPIVMLFGTADKVVPFRGGPVAPLPGQQRSAFNVWSADRLTLFFRRLNGCDGQPERTVVPGQGTQTVEVERSTKCAGGPVLVYRVVGGTHASAPAAVNTGRLLLDFFRDSRSRDLQPATR
jgi:polyhydroxybutyrate depolymerase